jgi:PPOX class probable F420-dependent enzyme
MLARYHDQGEPMADTIQGRSRELLEGKNFCMVTTLRKDGTPFDVITWVDVEDGRVLLNTAEGRSWPQNLRNDPRVWLVVPNMENPYEYVRIAGRVAEDTHDGADEHIDKLAKKYLGEEKYPFRQQGEVRVKLAIEPERVQHVGR